MEKIETQQLPKYSSTKMTLVSINELKDILSHSLQKANKLKIYYNKRKRLTIWMYWILTILSISTVGIVSGINECPIWLRILSTIIVTFGTTINFLNRKEKFQILEHLYSQIETRIIRYQKEYEIHLSNPTIYEITEENSRDKIREFEKTLNNIYNNYESIIENKIV